ncbi:TetR family transcriptional regulator [Streptomyces sp. NPDC057062]|uniref:TetR family transcriptional regulator n=1 Tax=Streptomyces sp. NPDC057062 TaxID=3346011 RepID=UPI0036351B70
MRAAGEATRQRIVSEAKSEFAAYGLAGARINRIATRARASKERLYAYFASKEDLFAAVVDGIFAHVTSDVDFDVDALPEWVGGLFDLYVADPEILRLYDRLALDGETGFENSMRERHALKIEELRKAQEAGRVSNLWEPSILLTMLIGIARLLAHERPPLSGSGSLDRDGLDDVMMRRRKAAVDAARCLVRAEP